MHQMVVRLGTPIYLLERRLDRSFFIEIADCGPLPDLSHLGRTTLAIVHPPCHRYSETETSIDVSAAIETEFDLGPYEVDMAQNRASILRQARFEQNATLDAKRSGYLIRFGLARCRRVACRFVFAAWRSIWSRSCRHRWECFLTNVGVGQAGKNRECVHQTALTAMRYDGARIMSRFVV